MANCLALDRCPACNGMLLHPASLAATIVYCLNCSFEISKVAFAELALVKDLDLIDQVPCGNCIYGNAGLIRVTKSLYHADAYDKSYYCKGCHQTTLVRQLVTSSAQTFGSITYESHHEPDEVRFAPPQCECGAEKCGCGHSDYCPLYKP